jgi:protein required for attachment to host cells
MKTTTWILIANSNQARVLQNTGTGKGLTQVDGMVWGIEPLSAQEIVTDRPGSFAAGGTGRSAMEPRTDPVEHRETQFVKSIASKLDSHLQSGKFDRLIVVAAPAALGDIRKAFTPAVQKAVIAEVSKDLTNMPTAELHKHIDGIIAP